MFSTYYGTLQNQYWKWAQNRVTKMEPTPPHGLTEGNTTNAFCAQIMHSGAITGAEGA